MPLKWYYLIALYPAGYNVTLQQLRCLCEVVNQGLNISRAARVLHTSQPAITKMIHALESELNVQLLVRVGPRIVSVTDEGASVVSFARQVVQEVRNLRAAANDSKNAATGEMRVATTNLQARYALLDAVRRFAHQYPDVKMTLCQGTPTQIATWVSAGEVDIGISTVPASMPRNVLTLEAYAIHRCIITPLRHPLLRIKNPAIQDLMRYRFIAYDNQLDTTSVVRQAFEAVKVEPHIVLRTSDADLVKSYVSAGLGIGVIQRSAITPADKRLRALNADHLFTPSTAWIAVRRDLYLRRFMYDFIGMVSPAWSREKVDSMRAKHGEVFAGA